MKIKTNFISGIENMLAPVMLLVWLGVIAFAAMLAWMLWDAAALKQEQPQLQQRLSALEQTVSAAPVQAAPNPRELNEMKLHVVYLNAITQGKGPSALAILQKLETLLPADVALTGLHYRAKDGELLLVTQGPDAETLIYLLSRLELDKQFESVILSQQKEIQVSGKALVQFEIRIKVRA